MMPPSPPIPSPAVWRSPAHPTPAGPAPSARARAPQSRLPVARSWRARGGWWTLPAGTLPLRASPSTSRKLREAKAPESPRERSGRLSSQAGRSAPPHQGRPGIQLSTYLPGRLLPGRSAALAARFGPGGTQLVRAVALRTGCPSFFLAPARFPRASRSLSSRWSWRSAPAVQHGASDPARCAPPRAGLRPGVPSRPPSAQRRRLGAALLHLVCPPHGARGVMVALARISSPPGWPGFAGAPASSHPSMNGT